MSHELMITNYENHICACCYEENRLAELQIISDLHGASAPQSPSESILGNIYIAKVQNIVKNLDAAFVEIQPGMVCYYSLKENSHYFMNQKTTEKVTIGDELLVQVTKESIKTKAPMVSSKLHLTGNLVIVTLGKGRAKVSNKLPKDEKTLLLKATIEKKLPDSYGAIIRTNAYESSIEAVEQELEQLLNQLITIVEQAKFRKVYSCLYQERTTLIRLMDDYNNKDLTHIITDIPEVYDQIVEWLPKEERSKAELFKEGLQPLYAIFRLDRDWKEIISNRVWLKSGAYLVIEQTEAMTVIDVNTGKAVNRNNREDHFLKVNQEASAEIARQLRLRNLSGIIIIDFIDMEEPAHKEQLIQYLCNEIRKDRIQTSYVDMTQLNLVELTRKKVYKPLNEQIFS